MKKFLALATIVLASSLCPAAKTGRNTFSVGDGKRIDFEKYKILKSSLRYHGREVETDYSIPGKIIHRYADGSSATNDIVRIDLRVQTNTVERKVDGLEQLNVALSNRVVKAMELFGQMSNRWAQASAKVEAIKTKNESAVESLEELKKKAPLLTTLIDRIEGLITVQEVSQ